MQENACKGSTNEGHCKVAIALLIFVQNTCVKEKQIQEQNNFVAGFSQSRENQIWQIIPNVGIIAINGF